MSVDAGEAEIHEGDFTTRTAPLTGNANAARPLASPQFIRRHVSLEIRISEQYGDAIVAVQIGASCASRGEPS
jgi:hypothetical protein